MRLAGTLIDVIARRFRALGRPILVGLAGPQGSGKSTLASEVSAGLAAAGLVPAILSLDDFYLTRAERLTLALQVHPLLTVRGPPGTHDIGMLSSAIEALLAGKPATLPRFDKGRDDRSASYQEVSVADLVLLEGWCVGATPQTDEALAEPVNALERVEDAGGVWRAFVNTCLAAYQPLFSRTDLLIQLRSPDFETVFDWRWEQEVKLRATAAGPGVMDQAGVRRFVQHYERITRHMHEHPNADVLVDLAPDRSVKALKGVQLDLSSK